MHAIQLLIIGGFCLCATQQTLPQQETDLIGHTVQDLNWLAGSWSGRQARSETEEHWIEPKGGMMLAVNRTTNGDKGFFEFLRIQQTKNTIVYYASPAGRSPVAFTLKDLQGQRVVFENLENEFPQRIIYQRSGDSLNVTIEGEAEGKIRTTQWTWKLSK